jgi:D-alanyl-D-alanine carboxypeptidase
MLRSDRRAGDGLVVDAAAPGVIVGVRTPKGTWTAAYGIADPATQAPMRVGMHPRIGSVTKTVTGTVVMQLAQQGKLSLDDVIDRTCPVCATAIGSHCGSSPT